MAGELGVVPGSPLDRLIHDTRLTRGDRRILAAALTGKNPKRLERLQREFQRRMDEKGVVPHG